MTNAKVLLAMLLVYLGCCSNVIFLEKLIKSDPGAGNIITCMQFVFVTLEGFFFTTKCLTVRNKIPIKQYIKMDMLFFIVSVVNNYAFYFNIPMPLHMIFRSGSLIVNMLLGVLILKKEYSSHKYISVVTISMGIFIATYASSKEIGHDASTEGDADDEKVFWRFLWWLVGIALLVFALIASALMGLFQEQLYKKYGKHPREAMFYYHALPLPAFLIFGSDILSRMSSYAQSEPFILLGISAPKMWVYLIGNIVTQYICVRGVFTLTTECPSLVVTLIVTLRKFISLLISIWYFQNPFTALHWFATFLVFGGTLWFSEVLPFKAKEKEE